MSRAAIVLAVLLLGPGLGSLTPASAEAITLPSTSAALVLGRGWTPAPGAGLVACFRSDAGAVLAVTRAQVPSLDAWRARTRDAYVDQIERGAAAALPGDRRLTRRFATVHGVPALDLEARRQDGATIVIRILLYRTYALALALEVPRGGDLAGARAIAISFSPPPPA